LSQRTPFDEISEGYEKFIAQLGAISSDWLRNNGTWFVPLSGTVIEFLADSAKIWVPQWVAQQYKKSKESDSE
jgi:hypothetical protein